MKTFTTLEIRAGNLIPNNLKCYKCEKPLILHEEKDYQMCLLKESLQRHLRNSKNKELSKLQLKVLRYINSNQNTNSYKIKKDLGLLSGTTSKIIKKLVDLKLIYLTRSDRGNIDWISILNTTQLGRLVLEVLK